MIQSYMCYFISVGFRNAGLVTIQIAGTTTSAPVKQAKIDITTRNPKN
jgi:hypothetical protein